VAREVRAREARAAQAPVARPPLVRRHPGALEGEPHIELDGDDGVGAPAPARRPPSARPPGEPRVDYEFDQRVERAGAPLARGERVLHASLGEGIVLACEGAGPDAKATVRFEAAGDKRVLARFLRPAG
jgi:DNA helicase II / ATP-dependent DNA helicase PcrA